MADNLAIAIELYIDLVLQLDDPLPTTIREGVVRDISRTARVIADCVSGIGKEVPAC